MGHHILYNHILLMEEQLWKMRVSHDIDFLITVETNTDPEI